MNIVLYIFLIIFVTSFIRLLGKLLAQTSFQIPYAAIFIFIGFLLGQVHHVVPLWEVDEDMVLKLISDPLLFHIYIAVFIFRTVPSMDWQLMKRNSEQIFLSGIVGALLVCFLCGFFFAYILGISEVTSKYMVYVIVFGGIFMATDNGEHVQKIKGSKRLEVLLEGESVCSTVLAATIIQMLEMEGSNFVYSDNLPYLPFTIICPILLGKLFLRFQDMVKCDVYTYVLCSTGIGFLIYFITLVTTGFSAIALFIFVCIMSRSANSLDQEITRTMATFWLLLYVNGDSMVCLLIGYLAAEESRLSYEGSIFGFIFLLYIIMLCSRGIVLLVISPLLARFKKDIDWKQKLVIFWAVMRCTGSLLIAAHIRYGSVAKTITYSTALVFFHLVIGGISLPFILKALKFGGTWRDATLNEVLYSITPTHSDFQKELLDVSYIFADADWGLIKETEESLYPLLKEEEMFGLYYNKCKDCRREALDLMCVREHSLVWHCARMNVFKIFKASIGRQEQEGFLTSAGYRILRDELEFFSDSFSSQRGHDQASMKLFDHLQNYWKTTALPSRIQYKLMKTFPSRAIFEDSSLFKLKKFRWDFIFTFCVRTLYWDWFVVLSTLAYIVYLVVSNFITGTYTYYSTYIFIACFLIQVTFEIIVWKCAREKIMYYVVDLMVIPLLIITTTFQVLGASGRVYRTVLLTRIIHLYRFVSIFKRTVPKIVGQFDTMSGVRVQHGLDIAKGLITAYNDLIKLIPVITIYPLIQQKIRSELEACQQMVVREIESINRDWPVISCSHATWQISNYILTYLWSKVQEYHDKNILTLEELEQFKKNLRYEKHSAHNFLRTVVINTTAEKLRRIPWVAGDEILVQRILDFSYPWVFKPGDTLLKKGEKIENLYLIITGFVRIEYLPDESFTETLNSYGQLPTFDYPANLDFFNEQTQYVLSGHILGELCLLTDRPLEVHIECVTTILLYVIPLEKVKEEIKKSNRYRNMRNLQLEIWKSVAVRICRLIMLSVPKYRTWNFQKMDEVLQKGILPALKGIQAVKRDASDNMQDIFLIEGIAYDNVTKVVFVGPCYIPVNVLTLIFGAPDQRDCPIAAKIYLVPSEKVDLVNLKVFKDTLVIVPEIRLCPVYVELGPPNITHDLETEIELTGGVTASGME